MHESLTEHLLEKHECMSYGDEEVRTCGVVIDGRDATLALPDWLPDVEPIITTPHGDLVFVVGRIHSPSDRAVHGEGVFMIARRRDDGVYRVHAWHALYRATLAQLGVDG